MDDTTLFRVVLYFLVVFTEQLFAALIGSGGNSRLPLASILLFAILLQLASTGMEILTLGIGLVGLVIAIIDDVKKE